MYLVVKQAQCCKVIVINVHEFQFLLSRTLFRYRNVYLVCRWHFAVRGIVIFVGTKKNRLSEDRHCSAGFYIIVH